MIYIAVFFIILYYFSFIVYYKNIFRSLGRGIPVFCTLLIVLGSYFFLTFYNLLWLNIFIILGVMTIGIRISARTNWLQAFFCGSYCVLSVYCTRGILTSIGAFIFQSHNLVVNPRAYYAITILTLPITLLFSVSLRRIVFHDNNIEQLMHSYGQIKIIVVYEIVATINLFVIIIGRNLYTHGMWYIAVALGACVLTLGMLIYLIYQSIKNIQLMEYKVKTHILNDQLARQLRHYKSYQKYTEGIRAFKHDNKSIMMSLKTLLHSHDNEKAIQLIDNVFKDLQNKVQLHKKYSNNIVLDAFLQDLANLCEEKGIRYSFNAVAPINSGISQLDAIRIFSNIVDNSVEACEKVPITERYINITSGIENCWVTLQVVNSYDGKVIDHNGKYITTKKDSFHHGFGLKIISEIVESLGGFVIFNADEYNKEFLIRVHIPKISN